MKQSFENSFFDPSVRMPEARVLLWGGLVGGIVGVASGAFLGGVVGTYRQAPDDDQSRLVVAVPDHRIGETRDVLRSHGATAVEDTVTHHEHPLREQASDARSS